MIILKTSDEIALIASAARIVADVQQALVKEVADVPTDGLPAIDGYSKATADALKGFAFDRKTLGARGLQYEKLDQLTIEVLLGVR